MKSIFDEAAREEIINRIKALHENNTRQWGKMTIAQMLKHCSQWDEMAMGKIKYKQSFLGKIVGKIALKDMLKDEPVRKGIPTVPSFVIKEDVNFAEEKEKWLKLLDEYKHSSNEGYIHPFFGAMKKADTGHLAYKHADHHLRQFGG